MTKQSTKELYKIAVKQVEIYKGECSIFQTMVESMLAELCSLSVELRGNTSIQDKEILPTFFTDDASELLLAIPSRYWFWVVLRDSIFAKQGADEKLIDADVIASAVVQNRLSLGCKFSLDLALEALTIHQVASRTAAGILLVKHKSFDFDEVLFNPLFAPCPRARGNYEEAVEAVKELLLPAARGTSLALALTENSGSLDSDCHRGEKQAKPNTNKLTNKQKGMEN